MKSEEEARAMNHKPGKRTDALKTLPQPMHLFEFLTRSQHYHFGFFQDPEEKLAAALNQLIDRCTEHLVPGGTVLDVGCGMGGTSSLLADKGFQTLGIDPNRPALQFAEKVHRPRENLEFLPLRFQDLLTHKRNGYARFDNILLIEVLQHIPCLDELFAVCRKLSRPGGVIVISDVMTVPALPWDKVPFYRQGKVRKAAEAAGWTVRDCQVNTDEVIPTLDRIIRRLTSSRDQVLAFFLESRPEVDQEVSELRHQCEQLKRAFANGDLVYETLILQNQDAGVNHG